MLSWQGDAHRRLAEVLLAAGKPEAAHEAFAAALERYERKKHLALASQLRSRLDALPAAAPEQRGSGRRSVARNSKPGFQSGCPDLNRGPLVPQTSALTRLRHTP